MKLFAHPDFEQAILQAADHFRSRGWRSAIIEKDYYVILNGVDTHQLNLPNGSVNFSAPPFTPFTINGGFAQGLNKLDFEVYNDPQNGGNPSGVRVEFTPSQEHQLAVFVFRAVLA